MALFCNGELFNKNHERYNEIKKQISEFDRPIRLISNNKRVRSEQLSDGSNPLYKFPNAILPLEANVVIKGIGETWRYSKYVPSIKNGEYDFKNVEKSLFINNGQYVIDCPNQAELAYFIIHISKALTGGEYRIDNPEKDSTERVNSLGLEAEVKRACLSKLKGSPFFGNDQKLRDICASWGISNSTTEHLDILREQLFIKVSTSQTNYSQTNRGYQSFLDELDGGDVLSEYRSNMYKGIEKKIISWNQKEKSYYWINMATGDLSERILNIPINQESQKEILLLNYLRNDIHAYETLQESLKGHENMPKNRYSHMDIKELRDQAKLRGVNAYQKGKLELELAFIEQDKANTK
jgi:hypothetical protein